MSHLFHISYSEYKIACLVRSDALLVCASAAAAARSVSITLAAHTLIQSEGDFEGWFQLERLYFLICQYKGLF